MPTADSNRPPLDVDLLISGGLVVTMDGQRRVIADGAVAIAAGQIVAVDLREVLEASCRAARRIDATGKTVIPGLINGHAHLPMTLFRAWPMIRISMTGCSTPSSPELDRLADFGVGVVHNPQSNMKLADHRAAWIGDVNAYCDDSFSILLVAAPREECRRGSGADGRAALGGLSGVTAIRPGRSDHCCPHHRHPQ